MYSVEWQKRGLLHSHTLIRLHDEITSNEIDDVISAEIPDENVDKGLYDIVVKYMIHRPCGALNEKSPCMAKGAQSGKTAIIKKHNGITIEVDNQWVVPYSPLLS